MGFIFQFYIIFGTNLLTGGPAQNCCFFAYFSVSKKRNIKRNETFGNVFFSSNVIQETWPLLQGTKQAVTRGGGAPLGRAPDSWAPRCSTDILLPPIYTYIPPNYPIWSQNPNSTAATFCTREIPSWGLFRSSAGGGIDHRGLLHQHHSLSDDV